MTPGASIHSSTVFPPALETHDTSTSQEPDGNCTHSKIADTDAAIARASRSPVTARRSAHKAGTGWIQAGAVDCLAAFDPASADSTVVPAGRQLVWFPY